VLATSKVVHPNSPNKKDTAPFNRVQNGVDLSQKEEGEHGQTREIEQGLLAAVSYATDTKAVFVTDLFFFSLNS